MRSGLFLAAVVALTTVSGCRIKSWESFEAATTPNPPGEWKGDEYASGGLANATGGLNTKTRYAEGSKNEQTSGINAGYGNPIKGSGLQPGENTVANKDGHGNQNSPSFDASPSSVQAPAARTGR
jgi:hypothetical protein